MVESIKYWCQQTGLIMDSAVCQGGYELADFAKFRKFARNVKGLSERFKAACVPYMNVSAALSAVERKKVDAISKKIREVVSGAPGLVRAALLMCLQELNGKENA